MPTATNADAHTALPTADEGLNDAQRAVAYIRVSTTEQAERGGFEEGFSIPAQRDAIRRAAAEAGAVIVEKFIDAGERSESTGVYETVLDPTNRLHAEFWQRTGQLHPDIDLDRNEETLPTDHGGRV
ncbi:MAG: recombinase family protein [Pseudonocardiaceae bacterium]